LDDERSTEGSKDLSSGESRQLLPREPSETCEGEGDDGVEVSSTDTTGDVCREERRVNI
jgi:hypothetical protein